MRTQDKVLRMRRSGCGQDRSRTKQAKRQTLKRRQERYSKHVDDLAIER